LDWIDIAQYKEERKTGSFENGNKLLFFDKLRGISYLVQEVLTSEERLYCKELNSVQINLIC
jgi:hypothetical protein